MLNIKLFRDVHDLFAYCYLVVKSFFFSIYFKIFFLINLWFELPRELKAKIKQIFIKILKRPFIYFIFYDKKKSIKDRYLIKRKIKIYVIKLILIDTYLFLLKNIKTVLKYWKHRNHRDFTWNIVYLVIFWFVFKYYEFIILYQNFRLNKLFYNNNSISNKIGCQPTKYRRFHYLFGTKMTHLNFYQRIQVPRSYKFRIFKYRSINDTTLFLSESLICGVRIIKLYNLKLNLNLTKVSNINIIFKYIYNIYIYYYITGLYLYYMHIKPYIPILIYNNWKGKIKIDKSDLDYIYIYKLDKFIFNNLLNLNKIDYNINLIELTNITNTKSIINEKFYLKYKDNLFYWWIYQINIQNDLIDIPEFYHLEKEEIRKRR